MLAEALNAAEQAQIQAVLDALNRPEAAIAGGQPLPDEFMRLWRACLNLAGTEDGGALLRQLFWLDQERKRLQAALLAAQAEEK
jgi:hypothetical protein